jgi:hypothetical protein
VAADSHRLFKVFARKGGILVDPLYMHVRSDCHECRRRASINLLISISQAGKCDRPISGLQLAFSASCPACLQLCLVI